MFILWIIASILNFLHFLATNPLTRISGVLVHILSGLGVVAGLVLLFAPVILVHIPVAGLVVLMCFVIASLGFGAGMMSLGNAPTAAAKFGSLAVAVAVALVLFKTVS